MAQPTTKHETAEFELIRDEAGGWGVRKLGEGQALSNHATPEEAQEGARLRGAEEEAVDYSVTVNEREVHELDEDERGMRPVFIYLLVMLGSVVVLASAIALIAHLTHFGA